MTSVINKRILACDYSRLLSWDFASNYLDAINTCSWPTEPLSQLVIIRKDQATQIEMESGGVLLLDRISFDEGRIFVGSRTNTKMTQYKAYKGDIVVSKIKIGRAHV